MHTGPGEAAFSYILPTAAWLLHLKKSMTQQVDIDGLVNIARLPLLHQFPRLCDYVPLL